jgi:hypothetical protein
MYLQLLAELIPIINKCFNYRQTPIAIDTLSSYLFNCWIALNSPYVQRLEDYSISIKSFINTPSTNLRISNILATPEIPQQD